MISVIVYISVATNAALIVFTLDIFPSGYSIAFQYWVFILYQWVIFFLQVEWEVIFESICFYEVQFFAGCDHGLYSGCPRGDRHSTEEE